MQHSEELFVDGLILEDAQGVDHGWLIVGMSAELELAVMQITCNQQLIQSVQESSVVMAVWTRRLSHLSLLHD